MKNIEKITKFCASVTYALGYPYFVNWSFPTNHNDASPDGEIQDATYVMFRVGRYPETKIEIIDGLEYENSHQEPVEKMLFFGSINRVVDYTPFLLLIQGKDHELPAYDDYPIKSIDDFKAYQDIIKQNIDRFLDI